MTPEEARQVCDKLCPTCNGTGAISDLDTRSLAGAFPEILVDCPSDCIPTALGKVEHVDPYTGEDLGSELIIVHLNPAHHALWCKTHKASTRWPHSHQCYEWNRQRGAMDLKTCELVVMELTERGIPEDTA